MKKPNIYFLILGMVAFWLLITKTIFSSKPEKPNLIEARTSHVVKEIEKLKTSPEQQTQKSEIYKDNPEIRHAVRSSSFELVDLFIDRIKAKKMGRKSAGSQRIQNQDEMKPLKLELIKQLQNSPVARDEYVKIIQLEKDPTVKSELLQVINKMSPEIQEEISLQLSSSDNSDDRKIVADMLPTIATKNAIETLVQATATDPDTEVRRIALEALSRFQPKGEGPQWADSTSVIPTLKQFTQSHHDLKTRETAFRGLLAQKFLTQEDVTFIAEFAEKETDSNLRQMAQDAQKSLTSLHK